ncbi:hypothetical protein JCM10213v2_000757 [Rhodosporidiobolus nylandii]
MDRLDGFQVVVGPHLRAMPLLGPILSFLDFPTVSRSSPSLPPSYFADKAARARADEPCSTLIFPEGDFVKRETRAKSASYAAREGVPDLQHLIHPRPLGTSQLLRTLSPRVPDLHVLDFTLLYPPPSQEERTASPWPCERFSFARTFTRGEGSAEIALHVRACSVDEMLGRKADGDTKPPWPCERFSFARTFTRGEGSAEIALHVRACSVDEMLGRKADGDTKHVERWLRRRWAEKDELIGRIA